MTTSTALATLALALPLALGLAAGASPAVAHDRFGNDDRHGHRFSDDDRHGWRSSDGERHRVKDSGADSRSDRGDRGDRDLRSRSGSRAAFPAVYVQECGSCHVAFAPALLPRESWARVMAGLDHHYGSDASLDAGLRREIETWLLVNASDTGGAREKRKSKAAAAPPEDRITRAPWFLREHRRIAATTWRAADVGNAANCGACHPGAARGDYDDDDVRLPTAANPRHLGSHR